jgi:hypothetical protein
MCPILTRILGLFLATAPMFNPGGQAAPAGGLGVASPNGPVRVRPKLLPKEVFVRHHSGRPPTSGFVTYIHPRKPILRHCSGWQDYSDGYDDYAVSVSVDNSKTWSKPEVRWKSSAVPEGRMRYAEPAAC